MRVRADFAPVGWYHILMLEWNNGLRAIGEGRGCLWFILLKHHTQAKYCGIIIINNIKRSNMPWQCQV